MLSLLAAVLLTPPQTPAELFTQERIWDVRLTFTEEQWKAMQPAPPGMFGPPGGFRPSGMVLPVFLKQGDTNYDGMLSRAEFTALGNKWFSVWDASKTGQVDTTALEKGLMATFKAPPLSLQAPEGKRNGVAGMLGIDFTTVKAALEIEGQKFAEVGVRYKGNGTYLSSMMALKRPLKIDVNEYVKDSRLAGIATLNLHNSVADASWMNDVLTHRLFRDAGVPAPRTSYARVTITVPNTHDARYLGLYEIVEAVDKNFIAAFYPGASDGALFKPSTPELLEYRGEDWKRYNQIYDPKGKPTEAQKKRLIALCKLVSTAPDSEFQKRIGEFIDLPAFARYMAALVCVVDLDGILGPGQNLYLYLHPKTNKFHFIPWDYDQSFGTFAMRGTQQAREQLSLNRPWQDDRRLLERLFAVPAFKAVYLAQVKRISTTLFTPERLGKQVDSLRATLRPVVEQEPAPLLSRFDDLTTGKTVPPPAGGFGPFGAPTKPIKAFVPVRAQSIRQQLAGKSQGMTLGAFSFPMGPPIGKTLAPVFLKALDTNKDSKLTKTELSTGLATWFTAWSQGAPLLTEEKLQAGLDRVLPPPPMPDFGPPPGGGGGE